MRPFHPRGRVRPERLRHLRRARHHARWSRRAPHRIQAGRNCSRIQPTGSTAKASVKPGGI